MGLRSLRTPKPPETIALIPPEHPDARLSACAYVPDQINDAVQRIMNGANETEH
jgi:hypothetical protein